MKLFQIDFNKLSLLLLVTSLRKPAIFAFITVCISAIISLYERFLSNRTANIARLYYTCQVCSLRKLLNDSVDPDLRRIEITDGIKKKSHLIAYSEARLDIVLIDSDTIVYSESVKFEEPVSFYVIVKGLVESENLNNELISLLNKNKLAGTNYKINYE